MRTASTTVTLHDPAATLSLLRAAVLGVVIATTGTACFGPRRQERLTEDVKAFSDDLRWERFDVAKNHLDPELLVQMGPALDAANGRIEVVDYEIRDIAFGEDNETAFVRIFIQWRITPDVDMFTGQQVQEWRYSGSKWFLKQVSGPLADQMRAMAAREAGGVGAPSSVTPGNVSAPGQNAPKNVIPKVYEKKPDI